MKVAGIGKSRSEAYISSGGLGFEKNVSRTKNTDSMKVAGIGESRSEAYINCGGLGYSRKTVREQKIPIP